MTGSNLPRLFTLSWLAAALAGSLLTAAPAAADPLALWNIVNGQCVPDWQTSHSPAPCLDVAIANGTGTGVAILKDRVGIAQVLAIPTRRITGIEDPQLLAAGAPDLFGAAWDARHFLFDRLGKSLPRDAIGLAINSTISRSQNQAHVHVDCLKPETRAELAKQAVAMTPGWASAPIALAGASYEALRIDGEDLKGSNLFQLVNEHLAARSQSVTDATIFAAGETFAGGTTGFVVLTTVADVAAGRLAHGEDLLSHDCEIAKD